MMQFAEFTARAAEIEAEPADLVVVSLPSDLFSDAGDDLPAVARFVQDCAFPVWDSIMFDIGPRLCHETIARAAGPNVFVDDVENRLADRGEIGAIAVSYDFGGQCGPVAFGPGEQGSPTVAEVDLELRAFAAASGSGSEETKLKTLYGLLNRTDPDKTRFLARLVLPEMCIGVGEGTARDAAAEAFLIAPVDVVAIRDDDADVETETVVHEHRNEAIAAVAHTLQVSNDYDMVAGLARDEGEAELDGVRLEMSRPVQAMLAQAGTAADALGEWGIAMVETKSDGARVQVHRDADGEVSLLSRNMEDVTDTLPEMVEFVAGTVDDPVILDGEVVAMDDGGESLLFQETLRHFRREHDVDRMREEVRVELRAFDCLHAVGDDLLTGPLAARHDRLTAFPGDDSPAVSDLLLSDNLDEIAVYEADALDAGHEGITLKSPDTPYLPGDCGKNWLKRKSDVGTPDLAVTGAEWGEGRRAEFPGTFLLSVRVEAESGDDALETIGKVATDITNEELAELIDLFEPEIEREVGKEVDIRPSVVFKVGYEGTQASPMYSSGYALRFPRFVTAREDKIAEMADSLDRVGRLADSQRATLATGRAQRDVLY